jgi:two-component system alkaline phosphatase synthesis response regulator PhoP
MENNDFIPYEKLALDLATQTVTVHDRPVFLTPLEFNVLTYLVKNRERYIRAEELLEKVWQCPEGGTENQVKSCIKRLRQKLALQDAGVDYIQSARGWGYRFGSPPPPDETDTELTLC